MFIIFGFLIFGFIVLFDAWAGHVIKTVLAYSFTALWAGGYAGWAYGFIAGVAVFQTTEACRFVASLAVGTTVVAIIVFATAAPADRIVAHDIAAFVARCAEPVIQRHVW